MKRFTILLTAIIAVALIASSSQAQVYNNGWPGHQHPQHHQHMPTVPLGPTYTTQMPHHFGHPITPHWAQPRHPDIVTAPQFRNYNQWGGIDTWNGQVDNTYYAPGRDASRYNGSARYVNRPVYDNYGRVVGYERGTEWVNSATGQVHGDKSVVTPNGSGGTHETTVLHATAGEGITPMNNGK